MLDFHGKGADFKRDLLGDVQDTVARMLNGISATIAGQKDGVIQSDQHRVLNFTGPGVQVSDDPSNRRMNILIPGTSTSSATITTIPSATTAKAFSLWNGSSNNAPPANWFTNAFDDSAWPNAVVGTVTYVPGGAANIRSTTGGGAGGLDQMLIRQAFTLPAGAIISASLQIAVDITLQDLYLNGVALTGLTLPHTWPSLPGTDIKTIAIPTGQLNAGASNVLAMRSQNDVDVDRGQVGFLITINSNATTGALSSVLLNYTYSGADLTNVSVPAATWTNVLPSPPSFTLAGTGAILLICTNGVIHNASGNNDFCASRLSIDSAASAFLLGGGYHRNVAEINWLHGAGPVVVTGLAAGSHTVNVQLYGESAMNFYLQPTSAHVQTEGLSFRVIQLA